MRRSCARAFLSAHLARGVFAATAVISACSYTDEPIGAKTVAFRYVVIDPAPNAGVSCCLDVLAVGDIDGDGLPDVVVGSENSSAPGLVWYRSPSWTKTPIATGQFTTDGKIADINGDGRADIVTCDYGKGIVWYENPKVHGSSWRAHYVSADYAHDIEVGDIDGDGLLDIVATDKKSLMVFLQRSSGTWRRYVVSNKAAEGLALADIDGDGDLDIVYGTSWYETPKRVGEEAFAEHVIAPDWHPETRVKVADMNGDGRPDVVLSVSESVGALAWFEAPPDPRRGKWVKHIVDGSRLEGVHSLQVADMDNDGDLDILAAEMHTSREKRVLLYINDEGRWRRQVLATSGSHNMQIADFDGDGDLDIVGKNYAGKNKPVELWINQTRSIAKTLSLERWQYIPVDTRRPSDQMGKMGLVISDLSGDGFPDLIAGSYLYLNPGGRLKSAWPRIRLPENVDVYFSVPIDGRAGLIGVSPDHHLVWLRATDPSLSNWAARRVAALPAGRTQGYASGRLFPGRRPQLVMTRGRNLFYIEIPLDPVRDSWQISRISSEVEEESIALADLDRDGDLDIVALDHTGSAHVVIWFENPGRAGAPWMRHVIGSGAQWLDRVAVADINSDGRPDVIVTEETQDLAYNANVYWFEALRDARSGPWKRHTIATLRSVNSLGVADMDGDGDPDIVVAEHTDFTGRKPSADNATLVLENIDRGTRWRVHVVERGSHSSHLGAHLADLDRDGDLDIVSIAWQQYQYVHLWRNDAPRRTARVAR